MEALVIVVIPLFLRLQELGAVPIMKCQDVDQEDWPVIGQWMDHVCTTLNDISVLPSLDYLDIVSSDEDSGYTRHQPYAASIVTKRELTTVSCPGDKETVHLEFDVGDKLTWTAGDALGIYPENDPVDVSAILSALGVSGEMRMSTPSTAYKPRPEKVTLREALIKYYDIKHVQPSLIQMVQGRLPKESPEKSRLDQLLEKGNSRIACVTAAIVRYRTLGVSRSGVTTSHLQDRLHVGDVCPVFISQNEDFRLPSNSDVPLILIGPGTGIAPFRAFIQERKLAGSKGKITLYFGCRHQDKDFLYRDKLEKLDAAGVISLRTAFSRREKHKIYVQHLLQEDADIVWKLINQCGAYTYVCGDARHMARDVHNALCHIIQGQGHMTEADAQQYLLELEKQNRYQKDVWVT